MSIKIVSVDGGYTAVVTPSPKLPRTWMNDVPLTADALTDILIEMGYHLQDIADAFHFADPDWMERP